MLFLTLISAQCFKLRPKRQVLENLSYSWYRYMTMNSNLVYVRLEEDGKHFTASFSYENKELNVSRSFNMHRLCSETIKDFTFRLSSNVEKVLATKLQRREKKGNKLNIATKVDVKLLLNSQTVTPELTCEDVLFKIANPSLVLRVSDIDYSVVINPPWIHNLVLPNAALAGFPLYPKKFVISHTTKEECEFVWSVSLKDEKATATQCPYNQVGKGFIYSPSAADIGHFIKLDCTPKQGAKVGPEVSVVTSKRVEAGPGCCPFETRHKFTTKTLSNDSFRVVTYNILADLYAKSDVARNQLFPYCPQYALDMDYRKLLLAKELIGYNADLVCLQEVDVKVFEGDLEPIFTNLKYEGFLTKKGGQVAEGVALFYRSSRFSLLDSHRVTLGEEINDHPCFSQILKKLDEYPALKERVIQRTTTLQVSVLKVLDKPDHRLVVANTHLYFQPAADHIRLLQAGLCTAFIKDVVEAIKKSDPKLKTSVIFCGDFNSCPDNGVYKLMTEKFVPADYVDWKSQVGEHVEALSLSQPFSLASACGTPEFTNYTVDFAGCLDYIFYQTDELHVDQVIPMPSKEEVSLYSALPSVVFPSDHIALVADLKWSH